MGRIVNMETKEVILESDDPAEIKTRSDELATEWFKDHEGGLPYAVEGFDSEELERGEAREPVEIAPSPTAKDRLVIDEAEQTITVHGDAPVPEEIPEDYRVIEA